VSLHPSGVSLPAALPTATHLYGNTPQARSKRAPLAPVCPVC